jgi:hypothetical protein
METIMKINLIEPQDVPGLGIIQAGETDKLDDATCELLKLRGLATEVIPEPEAAKKKAVKAVETATEPAVTPAAPDTIN